MGRDEHRLEQAAVVDEALVARQRAAPASEPTVRELVAAAAAGDQSSWNALVDRYAGLVWHVARGYRLSRADASDVTQTVWLRLVESLPRLREPAALGGWLTTTTRHESLRVLRRHDRELAADDVALESLLDARGPEPGASPDDVVEADERRRVVLGALDQLSERCQGLLRALAFSPERSYADISAALDMPVGSIGPSRSRCLDHLRRGLDGSGHLPGEG